MKNDTVFLSLSNDTIVEIGLYLPLRDLTSLNKTCKRFNLIFGCRTFWKNRYAQDFGYEKFKSKNSIDIDWRQEYINESLGLGSKDCTIFYVVYDKRDYCSGSYPKYIAYASLDFESAYKNYKRIKTKSKKCKFSVRFAEEICYRDEIFKKGFYYPCGHYPDYRPYVAHYQWKPG